MAHCLTRLLPHCWTTPHAKTSLNRQGLVLQGIPRGPPESDTSTVRETSSTSERATGSQQKAPADKPWTSSSPPNSVVCDSLVSCHYNTGSCSAAQRHIQSASLLLNRQKSQHCCTCFSSWDISNSKGSPQLMSRMTKLVPMGSVMTFHSLHERPTPKHRCSAQDAVQRMLSRHACDSARPAVATCGVTALSMPL